jgi:hypothetical protein
MKNSLDSAMQGIEGLINADGTGKLKNLPVHYKHMENSVETL